MKSMVLPLHFPSQLFFQASSYHSLIQEQYEVDKSRAEEIQRSLTKLEELGEEFQHPVTELGGEVFIGCCHHDLDQFSAI